MANLSVVIVNWNTSELLQECLKSIQKNARIKSYEVYVVDNASQDASVKTILDKFPWVKLIANNNNVGFSKANNQVLKKVKSEFVLVLNPDVQILKNSVEVLIDFLSNHPNVAFVGPVLLNPDKTVQKLGYYRIFPSLKQAWYFYTVNYNTSIKSKKLVNKYWEKEIDLNNETEVDQLPGACFLAKTDILRKINFFDENFPLLFEDVDLCFRVKKLRYKIMVTPKSKVIHIGGASFKKMAEVDVMARFFKGLFIFFDKHKNIIERTLIRIIILGDLFLLVIRKGLSQLIKPNPLKKDFIKNKWRLLKCLLA